MHSKRKSLLWSVLSLLMVTSMVLAACGPTSPTPTEAPKPTEAPTAAAPTEAPKPTEAPAAKKFRVGMVSDVGGIDDRSFNQNTWEGLEKAAKELPNVEAKFLESQAQADYENNITEFAEQGYDMIITVGFLLGDATAKMAKQYPDVKFAIVDFAYDPPIPNVQGIVFNVDEASFPVGFLAAAMADKTDPDDPMVAYIAGMQIPPVEQFIVAYEAGVKYYNEKYGKNVRFTGVYVGDFEAPDEGKVQANSLIDEGADVIMGVGGKTGNGGLAAAKERGKLGVGVDVDQYYTLPNEKDILITSTMKRLDNAVFNVVKAAVEGNFGGGGVYVGTLENGGVGVGPFHDQEANIPDNIKADLKQIQADIIAGKLWTGWGEPPEAAPAAKEGAAYKVGFASAITGPASSLGVPERDVAQMLKDEVTEIVGPDGVKHPLEIIIYDTEGKGETAVTVVNKMINEDKVVAIVAGSRSPVSMALVPVVTEAKVPYVSMASSGAIVTPVEERYWVFKTPQSNDPVAYNQVQYLKALGVKKIASLYVNNAFGEDSRKALEKWASEAGIEVVLEESFEAADTDMTAQLTKVKASDAEALVVHAIPPGASIITQQFRELGLDIPLIQNHGVCSKKYIELAGAENAEGTVFPCGKMLVAEELPDSDPQKQTLLDFISWYEKGTGNPRSTFAGHAWDALQLVFSALKSLPDGLSLEEQRAAVRDYIENDTAGFVGTGGVFQISPKDHVGLGPDSMVLLKVENGDWTYFGPEKWPAKEGAAYKLGFCAAITGPGSSLGVPERNTAEMIAAQLNEQGGVLGPDGVRHPVEVIIYDTESNPDTAASVASRLITEDKVQVLVCGTLSGNSMAIVPLATENEVPMISMASARAIIQDPETKKSRKWIFKTPQENLHSGEWQALYLEAKGITKICDLYENTGYGQDCLKNTKAAVEAKGIEVVYEDSFERSDTEFPQMASVTGSGCEALVVGAIPPGASMVTVAARDENPDLPVIQGHGVCNQAFIDLAGDAAEGVVFPCGRLMVADLLPDDDPQKPVLQQYIADYTAFTNGEPISTFGGHAWDALMWAVEGLSSLEDGMTLAEQRAAIRDYIEGNITNWPGTGGVFNITPDDHLGLTYEALTFVKVENGTWVYFPPDQW